MKDSATNGELARLRYEPISVTHADELFIPLSDARLYRFMPAGPPTSIPALRERYRKLAVGRSPDNSQTWLNWIVREQSTGAAIGLLQATVSIDGAAGIAYFIFSAWQRQGYALEAVRWMLDHMVAQHGVHVATADVDTRNDASNGLLAKLGFEQIGTTPDADHFKGATSDEYHYRKRLGPMFNDINLL